MGRESKNRVIIGLTGTIGSGKSYVAELLVELGADIIDTDIIAREVVEPGTRGLKAIVERWGEAVLHEDGTLNREKVAEIVFKDDRERAWLNEHLHPLIGHETALRMGSCEKFATVLVVPLLFESGMDAMVDQTWVVAAHPDELVRRIRDRDKCSEEAARARIATQMDQEEKKKRADVVIDNSGPKEDTRKHVMEALKQIEKL